jgi:hypothetical protein
MLPFLIVLALAGDFGFDIMEHDILALMTEHNAALFTVAGLRSGVQTQIGSGIACDSRAMENTNEPVFWDVICWNASEWSFSPSLSMYWGKCHVRAFGLDGPATLSGVQVAAHDELCLPHFISLIGIEGFTSLDVVTVRTDRGQPKIYSKQMLLDPKTGHHEFGPFITNIIFY